MRVTERSERSTRAMMEGRKAKAGERCPYSRELQPVEFYSWIASYRDNHGSSPPMDAQKVKVSIDERTRDLILKDFEERREIQSLILGRGKLSFLGIGKTVKKGKHITRRAYYCPEEFKGREWFPSVEPLLERRRALRERLNEISVINIAKKFGVSSDAVKRVQANAKTR